MKSAQQVKFFVVDRGLDPQGDLEKSINKWIEKGNKTTWKLVVDAISYAEDTVAGHTTYTAMLLYHNTNE